MQSGSSCGGFAYSKELIHVDVVNIGRCGGYVERPSRKRE